MASFASPIFVAGDLNVRFDRPNDVSTVRVNDLLSSYGATQHVNQPTHTLGGILDVITGDDCRPTCVDVDNPGLSDHSLVRWLFNLRLSSEPVYEERERRLWRHFDPELFRSSLSSSCLCDANSFTGQSDVNALVESYNSTIEKLLDVHAPRRKVTCRVRRRTDPWYDSGCRAAKRRTRKLERRYKRWRSDHARSVWIQSLRSQHKLVDQKRNAYWQEKIESQRSPTDLWRTIDTVLCRERPNDINPARSASDFADFFEAKEMGYALLLTMHRRQRSVTSRSRLRYNGSRFYTSTTSWNWSAVRQPNSHTSTQHLPGCWKTVSIWQRRSWRIFSTRHCRPVAFPVRLRRRISRHYWKSQASTSMQWKIIGQCQTCPFYQSC